MLLSLSTYRRLLTPRRMSYAWWTACALWGAWLASLILGSGYLDLAGQPVGTDYLQFYAAGVTVRTGQAAHLYDLAYQADLEQQIIGPGLTTYHAFITPPFLAWLFVPLSLLPYGWSFALWSIAGIVALWFSLRLLGVLDIKKQFLWALTYFPVFAAISYGQNALLSLLLLSAGYHLLRRRKGFIAGIVLSFVLYKPQLLLGVGILFLLDIRRSWKALAGLVLGGGSLVALCFGLLPTASRAYVGFASTVLPDLPNWQDFPIWHLNTVRGFWRLLIPWWPTLGDVLALGVGVLAILAYGRLWTRFRDNAALAFSGAMLLGLVLTPHAMIYDWALLLIPALLLRQAFPVRGKRWQVLYALVWIVSLLSDPLAYLQLQLMPVALQISVPVMLFCLTTIYRDLVPSPGLVGDEGATG